MIATAKAVPVALWRQQEANRQGSAGEQLVGERTVSIYSLSSPLQASVLLPARISSVTSVSPRPRSLCSGSTGTALMFWQPGLVSEGTLLM